MMRASGVQIPLGETPFASDEVPPPPKSNASSAQQMRTAEKFQCRLIYYHDYYRIDEQRSSLQAKAAMPPMTLRPRQPTEERAAKRLRAGHRSKATYEHATLSPLYFQKPAAFINMSLSLPCKNARYHVSLPVDDEK